MNLDNHKIGDIYLMINMDGKKDKGGWKIAYYPLSGTYKGELENKKWVDFSEPRALIERPMEGGGTDFREVSPRYLEKYNK